MGVQISENRGTARPLLLYGSVDNRMLSFAQPAREWAWEIIRGCFLAANTGEETTIFQPLLLHFPERRDRYRGQTSCFTRKLCLQSWTQFLQKGWYCRRPVSPRKKAHSIRHFLLRLIDHHAPGCCGWDAPYPGTFVPRIPVSRSLAVPE